MKEPVMDDEEFDQVRAFVWAIQADIKISFDLKISDRWGVLLALAIREASKDAFVFVTRDGIPTRVTHTMPLTEI